MTDTLCVCVFVYVCAPESECQFISFSHTRVVTGKPQLLVFLRVCVSSRKPSGLVFEFLLVKIVGRKLKSVFLCLDACGEQSVSGHKLQGLWEVTPGSQPLCCCSTLSPPHAWLIRSAPCVCWPRKPFGFDVLTRFSSKQGSGRVLAALMWAVVMIRLCSHKEWLSVV